MATRDYDLDRDISQFELRSNTGRRRTGRAEHVPSRMPPPTRSAQDLDQFPLRSQTGWGQSRDINYFGMQPQSRPRPSQDLSHFELDLNLFDMQLTGEQDEQTLRSRDLTLRSNFTHNFTPAPARMRTGTRQALPTNWSHPVQPSSNLSRPSFPPPPEIPRRRYSPSPDRSSRYGYPTSQHDSSPFHQSHYNPEIGSHSPPIGYSCSPPQPANSHIPRDKHSATRYRDQRPSKSRERVARGQSPSSQRPLQNHRTNKALPLHTFARSRQHSESSSSYIPEKREVSRRTLTNQSHANTIRRGRQRSRRNSPQSIRNSPSPKGNSQVRGKTVSPHSRANSRGREESRTRPTSQKNAASSSRRSSLSKNPPKRETASPPRKSHSRANSRGREESRTHPTSQKKTASRRSSPSKDLPKRTPSPPKPKSILKTQTWTNSSPPKQKTSKTKGKNNPSKNTKGTQRKPHETQKSVGKNTVTSKSMVSSPPVPIPDYGGNARAMFIPTPDY